MVLPVMDGITPFPCACANGEATSNLRAIEPTVLTDGNLWMREFFLEDGC